MEKPSTSIMNNKGEYKTWRKLIILEKVLVKLKLTKRNEMK